MEDQRVDLHSHAHERLAERGVSEAEVVTTVRQGERIAAKLGRAGFRRDFPYEDRWRGKVYATKRIEAFAVFEDGRWLVISFVTKFF